MITLLLLIIAVITYFSAFCQKQEVVDYSPGYDIAVYYLTNYHMTDTR